MKTVWKLEEDHGFVDKVEELQIKPTIKTKPKSMLGIDEKVQKRAISFSKCLLGLHERFPEP